jgi:hypothetical protein
MRLNTVASIEKEISELDLGVISDILNSMRRKSGLAEKWDIPPITVRWWTFNEKVSSLLMRRYIPIGITFDNPDTGLTEVNILVPPIENKRNTELNQILYILAHELAHAFSVGLKYRSNHAWLTDLNKWLTEVVAIKIYYEYCERKWIHRSIDWFGYLDEMQKISELIDALELRWYGDHTLILESLIQGYISGIDMLVTLQDLLSTWVDYQDVETILNAIGKPSK